MAIPYNPTADTRGLWHLNGNSTDSSSYAKNGTDTSITYGLNYGKFDQGASFNGSSSVIIVGGASDFSIFGDITVSAWIYTSSNHVIASKRIDGAGLSAPYYLSCQVFARGAQGGAMQSTTPIMSVPTNTWTLVTGVGSGSSIYSYMNGVLVGSYAGTYPVAQTSYAAVIGATRTSDGNLYDFFNGYMDEVIIEDVAWSASKILNYYNATLGKQPMWFL